MASATTGERDAGFPAFTASEYSRRFALVDELFARHDLDALLLYGSAGSGAAVQYLSGFIPRQPTWLIISPGRSSTLFLHFLNHVPTAEAMSIVDDVRCYWPSAPHAVADELRRRPRGRVGVVGLHTSIPHHQFRLLEGVLADVEFRDVGRPYNEMRWVRSDEEIAWITRSGELMDDACQLLAERLRPGITEFDVKASLHESFVPRGGEEGIIFISSTSMEDPRRKSPWQFPTSRVLRRGDVVLTEITITYAGYGAQIHRPFAVGAEPTSLYRDMFEAAREGFERVRAVLRTGAGSEEVRASAGVVEDRGFAVFDSVVHGEGGKNPELGSPGSGHEPEPWTFQEGQVMVVQPNPVTRDGRAGLQAGCAVRVGNDGAVPLHGYPLEFPVCG